MYPQGLNGTPEDDKSSLGFGVYGLEILVVGFWVWGIYSKYVEALI